MYLDVAIHKSKEETISFLKPCYNIFRGMGLEFSEKEGEFLDNKGNAICFAANVYNNSKSHLLIKKEPFMRFLEANNLKIVWTILGEKQILGGRKFKGKDIGRLEFSGAYYFEKDELIGKTNTVNT